MQRDHGAEPRAAVIHDGLAAGRGHARRAVAAEDRHLGLTKLLAAKRPRERERIGLQRRFPVAAEQPALIGPRGERHDVRGHPVQLARGAVVHGQGAVPVAGQHARLQALEQCAQELALPLERPLHRAPAPALLVLLDRASHRGRQAMEPGLEQVVGGAAPQALHGGILADCARDQDERGVGRESARDLQCGEAIELRQGVVGQDDVRVAPFQSGHEPFAGGDAFDLRLDVVLAQRLPHEQRVARVVLKVEDDQRLLHGVSPPDVARRPHASS